MAAALGLEGVERVLDLGGGSGGYSIAFAHANPALEATVFDLPTVTPLTRAYAGSAYSEAEYRGWLEQAGFGDVERLPLPGPTALMVARKG